MMFLAMMPLQNVFKFMFYRYPFFYRSFYRVLFFPWNPSSQGYFNNFTLNVISENFQNLKYVLKSVSKLIPENLFRRLGSEPLSFFESSSFPEPSTTNGRTFRNEGENNLTATQITSKIY